MKIIPVVIKTVDNKDRIKKFLEITYKFHKLTDREIDILVEFIAEYQNIAKAVSDTLLVNKLLFSAEIKQRIGDKNNVARAVMDNYLHKFRDKNVIKGNILNPSFIPPAEQFEISMKFL